MSEYVKSFSDYTKEILVESSLSRLYQKYKDYDSGTISAFRGEFDKNENMKRHRELRQLLVAGGYSVTEIDGTYIENYGTSDAKKVKEKSMIVFDHKGKGDLLKVLKKLGEKYDQDSITFSSVKEGKYYLVGTSKRDNSYPGYGVKNVLGKPMFGKDGMFCSEIKGRPFVFSESLNEETNLIDDYLTKHHPFVSFQPLTAEFERIMNE